MPKPPNWADEGGTDPGGPGGVVGGRGGRSPVDDEIEEIPRGELGAARRGGQQVHLRAVPGRAVEIGAPEGANGADKTRVASVADMAPPAEKTRISSMDQLSPGASQATMITTSPVANSEATVITSNPLAAGRPQRQTTRGRLVVTEGKEAGRVFELTDGERTLGRSREADLCLLDIQVSRRHCELVADHNGVLLRDLGSGNGTVVNGQSIDETRLVHGDEIALGDHILRFEEDGPVAAALAPAMGRGAMVPSSGRPMMPAAGGVPAVPSVAAVRRARREQPGAGRKKLLIALATVGAIVVVGVAIKAMQGPPAAPVQAGPTPAQVGKKAFQEGLDHFRNERYSEALERFQASLAAQPQDDKSREYVEASKREISAGSALAEAERYVAEGQFGDARTAFQRVDASSLRASQAQRGLQKVDEAEAQAAVREGDDRLDENALEDARSAYNKALSLMPGMAEAESGLARVDDRELDLKRNRKDRERNAASERRRAQAEKAREAKRRLREAMANGENLFDSGKFSQALSAFESTADGADGTVKAEAAKRVAAIKAFIPAYESGMKAADAKSADAAVKHLSSAAAKAKVVKPGGKIHAEISKKLGDMLFLQGRMDYNAGRHAESFQAWSKALKFDPGHKYAGEGMKDLETLGKTLYLEAYTQKSLNRAEAVRKWQKVVKITPPSFEYHQKALKLLGEMGGGG